jgi:hypothetical protein
MYFSDSQICIRRFLTFTVNILCIFNHKKLCDIFMNRKNFKILKFPIVSLLLSLPIKCDGALLLVVISINFKSANLTQSVRFSVGGARCTIFMTHCLPLRIFVISVRALFCANCIDYCP